MVIYKYTEEKREIKGEIKMLNDEICKLRDKLNKSIEDNEDYDEERYEKVLEESFSVYSCSLFLCIIK